MKRYLSILILLASSVALCQPSPYTNAVFDPVVPTGTGWTSAPIQLARYSINGNGFSLGTITVKATELSTVTFGVLVSSDGGASYYATNIWNSLTPGSQATTATATIAGQYNFSLTGITHIKYITAGTFTATGLSFTLTATAAPSIQATVSGGGGSGTIPNTPNLLIGGANNTAEDSGVNPNDIPQVDSDNTWTGINTFGRVLLSQISGAGGPVTVAVNPACAGTGATASVSAASTDVSGAITLTVGTNASVSCALATITFVPGYSTAPNSCGPPAALSEESLDQVGTIYYGVPTPATFTINIGPNAIAAGTTIVEGYKCL